MNNLIEELRKKFYYKDGCLWSKKFNRTLGTITNGYYTANVRVGGKVRTLYQHRIVWLLENGPIPDGMIVSFKDGNKLNIAPENLVLIKRTDTRKKGVSDKPVCKIFKDDSVVKPWVLRMTIPGYNVRDEHYATKNDAVDSFKNNYEYYCKEWEFDWEESATEFHFDADNFAELVIANSDPDFFFKEEKVEFPRRDPDAKVNITFWS